jgi:hypothetical protein
MDVLPSICVGLRWTTTSTGRHYNHDGYANYPDALITRENFTISLAHLLLCHVVYTDHGTGNIHERGMSLVK